MRNTGKRRWRAAVVPLLCAAILTVVGCASGGQAGTSSEDKRELDENGVYTTGYPIVKEPITLSVMTYDFNNGVAPETTALVKELEKKTNIHLKWTVSTGEAAANLQATYASGDLPDIITGFYCDIAYQWPYIEQQMIQQLDDLIPKYAPNIQAMFKEQPYTQYMSTALDGHIYSLPNVRVANDADNNMGMLINTKWLNALGLSKPTTTTELANVLRAFKNGDPNGNGRADEIPMLLHTDLPNEMFGWFGVSYNTEFPMYLNAQNEAAYAPLSEGYKSTLKFAASLANEGLLDTTFIGVDDITGFDAVLNSTVETAGVIGGWNITLYDMDSTRQLSDYEYLGPLSADGASFVTMETGYPSIWADKALISSKCANAAAALRLLDFFYSDEGAMWASYGPPSEDNAWHIDENGKFVKTLSNCPANTTTTSWLNSLTVGQCLPVYMSARLDELIVEDESSTIYKVKARDVIERKAKMASYKSAQIPDLRYDEDALLFIQAQGRSIRDPMENTRRAIIKGEKNIDAIWDTYVSETNTRGAKKYTEYATQAYKNFQDWMASQAG